MNLTELRGEKTIKALAKRLLEQPAKNTKTQKSDTTEMEAALLRLNPHLGQIGDLEKGTPVLLPENFPFALEEATPVIGNAADLLEESETAFEKIRATLAESVEKAGEQGERVQAWLKGDGTKELIRRAPELREVFASAAAAAKGLRKEQASLADAEMKALEAVQAELARFRENLPR